MQTTRAVEALMGDYLTATDLAQPTLNLFTRECEAIKQNFPLMISVAGNRWDLQTLDRVHGALRSSERGAALAKSCAAAAAAYRAAHAKLVQALNSGGDLEALLEEIKTLAQQIKAGKEVSAEIKNKAT